MNLAQRNSVIICGKCEDVLPSLLLPPAQMIFADPPDNIGLQYDGNDDKLPEETYKKKLCGWLSNLIPFARVTWFSVNKKHEGTISAALELESIYYNKIIWYFTFGQHNSLDCGNNYRPIFRISPVSFCWGTDAIRIPSKRLKLGDVRADPRGRVPGDVWGGPEDEKGFCRIQGNNKERRSWHPTQHPEKLVERAIKMSTDTGGLVIDPFLGSGTTLRACLATDRLCIGIDSSEKYCELVSSETGVPMVKYERGGKNARGSRGSKTGQRLVPFHIPPPRPCT